jgi:hypothetical protein
MTKVKAAAPDVSYAPHGAARDRCDTFRPAVKITDPGRFRANSPLVFSRARARACEGVSIRDLLQTRAGY